MKMNPKPRKVENHPFYDDVFRKLSTALQGCQDWVLFGGYQKQWRKLSKEKQLAAHLVLKKLLDDADKIHHHLRTDPLLWGMLKHEIYLKYQSAGPKLEHQTLAIAMLAYTYIAASLEVDSEEEGETMPAWPDMEYVMYVRDPGWLFLGGRPRTMQEVKSKFMPASGSSAVIRACDLRIDCPRVNVNNLREFRDTTVFGSDDYLP